MFLAITAVLLFSVCPVMAEVMESNTKSEVVFTADGKLRSTFRNSVVDDTISEYLEPGDTAVFTIELRNENADSVDFWMDQRTVDSLEVWGNDAYMTGGGYRYELTYEGPGGSRTLYSSVNIDGSDFQANTASSMTTKRIDETSYIFLDTYASGKSGKIVLQISLDGESQGNDYQSTKADVSMDFAVELTGNPEGSVIKTGDTMNALPFFVAMTAAGLILLLIALYVVQKRRKQRRAVR